MICNICGSDEISVSYHGPIRAGSFGNLTEVMDIYECAGCGVKWHSNVLEDIKEYYESEDYRVSVNGENYYHNLIQGSDEDALNKFKLTGTGIWRDKIVADIGCAAGGMLDFIYGVAKETIAVEPALKFKDKLAANHHYYQYINDAQMDWSGQVDVITCYDVFEHLDDPLDFLRECFDLLNKDGVLYIGVPTDYPILRALLGDIMNQFVYSEQHIWYHTKKSLEKAAQLTGFKKIHVKSVQLYGLGNLISWCKLKEPRGDVHYDFITETLENTFRAEAEKQMLGDYLFMTVTK